MKLVSRRERNRGLFLLVVVVVLMSLWGVFHGAEGYKRQLRIGGLGWTKPLVAAVQDSADARYTLLFYRVSQFQDGPLYFVTVISKFSIFPTWTAKCGYPPLIPDIHGWVKMEDRKMNVRWQGDVVEFSVDGYLVAAYDAKRKTGEAVDLQPTPDLFNNYGAWSLRWQEEQDAILIRLGIPRS